MRASLSQQPPLYLAKDLTLFRNVAPDKNNALQQRKKKIGIPSREASSLCRGNFRNETRKANSAAAAEKGRSEWRGSSRLSREGGIGANILCCPPRHSNLDLAATLSLITRASSRAVVTLSLRCVPVCTVRA